MKLKGNGCLLFKKDLKRAYRQISLDPKDYNLVSLFGINMSSVIRY